VPFVRALLASIAHANPSCRFRAGVTHLNFWGSTFILVASLFMLAYALMAFGLPASGIVIVKLVILAFLVPLGLSWVKRNRPRPFDPDNIPQDVLPPVTPDSPPLQR
jgi:hypothetical protein